ncbi:hypothetical protein JCM19294_2308 [Nonlabens tegetincola]|uniref:EF-hand domain-containing protein n=2 Tax=Nonlabens tegetincola TaxID=323273 RepID=A0A090QJ47_9FLAO|nr:hypothetical protein JCM19294_2308 [Nonlabens tegetincola]
MFHLYQIQNESKLRTLRSALKELVAKIKNNKQQYFEEKAEYFKEGFDPSSFKEAGDIIYNRLVEPIVLQSNVMKSLIASRWISFLNPFGTDPIEQFELFYNDILEYLFIEFFIYDKVIDHKLLLKELENFYLYFHIYVIRLQQYKTQQVAHELILKHNVNTSSPFVNVALANIKEIFDDEEEMMDSALKAMLFDKLLASFINNFDNKNTLFYEPEKTLKEFFLKLDRNELLNVDYTEFRKLLVFNDESYENLSVDSKIKVSAVQTVLTLEDIGGIFFELFNSKNFKGNKKVFHDWIRGNFLWYRNNGLAASMTNNSLSKYVKDHS